MQRLRYRHLSAAIAVSFLAASPASAETLYIAAGRLIDGVSNAVRTGQCITVEAERIKAVGACGKAPDGATIIDWSGFTVLPGLIDLHTHLADLGQSADLAAPMKASPAETALVGARNARVTLDAGFTSVRDVGTYRGLTDVTLRNAIGDDTLMRSAGQRPVPESFTHGTSEQRMTWLRRGLQSGDPRQCNAFDTAI